MKILFFAPRFHTNQVSILKALVNAGHQVRFLVEYKGATEDYSVLNPEILESTIISKCLYRIIDSRNIENAKKIDLKMRYYIPDKKVLNSILKKFNPDLVIVRDRMISSAVFTHICRKENYNIVLYNQLPLEYIDRHLIKRVMNRIFFPKYRITPIREKENHDRFKNSFFVPFVVPDINITNSISKSDNIIKICTVGKFYKRKNFLLLLDVFSRLALEFDVELTIIGEVSNEQHESYYKEVCDKIKKYNLEDKVHLKVNIPYRNMEKEYIENDLFVLASTRESAAISHLEAMSYGLFSICSSDNGTAGYIASGITGDVFRDSDENDLYVKLRSACVKIIEGKLCRDDIRAYIRYHFSATCYIDKFLNMYNLILKEVSPNEP